ncbi:MAG TPA: FkbM family methyltransferase [Opitutaceae bacterium]|jgi:FkbM family methyltransferase|nr:FkbM family methyltransferase [Opitutaceae bacterium]
MILTTKSKITIEKWVSRLVLAARKTCRHPSSGQFSRNGLQWSLDLQEGIDFSIYFLGSFERSLHKFYEKRILPGQTVLDIGANIGAHTMHFARTVGPSGRVVAVEATDYAYNKLCANLDLNPKIRSQISARQVLLAASALSARPEALHSSWPLDEGHELHATHQGELKSLSGARVLALDELVLEEKLTKVDWIKLDVDGNELSVLKGATAVLDKMHPPIVMELAPSCYQDSPGSFDELHELLLMHGYAFYSIPGLRPLPSTAPGLKKLIPDGASINAMLISNRNGDRSRYQI